MKDPIKYAINRLKEIRAANNLGVAVRAYTWETAQKAIEKLEKYQKEKENLNG